jgi:hypothetical protein
MLIIYGYPLSGTDRHMHISRLRCHAWPAPIPSKPSSGRFQSLQLHPPPVRSPRIFCRSQPCSKAVMPASAWPGELSGLARLSSLKLTPLPAAGRTLEGSATQGLAQLVNGFPRQSRNHRLPHLPTPPFWRLVAPHPLHFGGW